MRMNNIDIMKGSFDKLGDDKAKDEPEEDAMEVGDEPDSELENFYKDGKEYEIKKELLEPNQES